MCVKEHQRAHYNRKSDAREQDRPRPASCEVCGSTNGKERLAWDHCHTTGRFRGWLCKQCNVALGLVKDNPNTLIKLSSYLIASMQKALIPKPRPS